MSIVMPPYESDDTSYQSLDRVESKSSNTRQIAFFVSLCALLIFLMLSPRLFPDSSRPADNTLYSFVTCTPTDTPQFCQDPTHFKLIHNLTKAQVSSKLSTSEVILARGYFDDLVNATGWATLILDTMPDINDDNAQAISAGYLEGFLTSERISQALVNGNHGYWEKKPEDAYQKVEQWLKQQKTYISSQIQLYVYSNATTPEMKNYWGAVELIQSLHSGMVAGYNAALAARGEEPQFDLSVQLFRSEFGDIINNIFPEITKNCWDMTKEELDEFIGRDEHCSSLSKTTVDVSSLSCAPLTKLDPSNTILTKQLVGDTENILIFTDKKDKSQIIREKTSPLLTKNSLKKTKKFLVTDDSDLLTTNKSVLCTMEYTNDFIVAHDTWTSFYDLLRIIKTYKLDFQLYKQIHYKNITNNEHYEPFTITLTGYPGLITSYDDYYILPSSKQQLIITETTNSNCNKELYTYISPRSILTSQRTFIASILADSSPSWAQYYAKENSGTYNNQWMIIDGKLWPTNSNNLNNIDDDEMIEISIEFISPEIAHSVLNITKKTTYPFPYEILNVQVSATHYPMGFYVIAEQTPQFVAIKDVSQFVNNKTFWPSYNRPYIDDVYFSMGFQTATEKLGDFYSYTNYSRARIMNRDLPPFFLTTLPEDGTDNSNNRQNTSRFDDVMRYMRYNNYEQEEFSQKCPIYTIASRYDLIPAEGCGAPLSKPNARGQTDVKISSINAIAQRYSTNSFAKEYFPFNTIFTEISNSANRLDFRGNRGFHRKSSINDHDKSLLWVIAGPTTGNDVIGESLPHFTWDDPRWEDIPHLGHPSLFNFTWVEIQHPN